MSKGKWLGVRPTDIDRMIAALKRLVYLFAASKPRRTVESRSPSACRVKATRKTASILGTGLQPMLRTKSGLPKHCGWNKDQHGIRRVRFRKAGFSTYLTGIPWSDDFMRQYAAALDGVKAQASNIGAERTVAGSLGALVVAYLDPLSKSSPFKTGAPETQRTRRNILENFCAACGRLPLFRTDSSGRRTMLLTR